MSVDRRRFMPLLCRREEHAKSVAGFILLLLIAVAAPPGRASTIFVTSTQQKISSSGGCSLQEAIYAANLDSSQAVASVDSNGVEQFIPTECVAGSGDDTIILPTSAFFLTLSSVDDVHNFMGRTATPMITSTIIIQGNGAEFQSDPEENVRLFAVGPGGNLTINEMYIRNFVARGGNGVGGGSGGMGAGGAIYVAGGSLTVIACTFDNNAAVGGSGSAGEGGGGGGISGNGGFGAAGAGGGGGGGARGTGGNAGGFGGGAGGGGTLTNGADTVQTEIGAPGGVACGGRGGNLGDDASDACDGGGGGGGGGDTDSIGSGGGFGGNGGHGGYGGGGGGGGTGFTDHDGGIGGFGGGGGSGGRGGTGGYGGGGGASGGSSFITLTPLAGGPAGRFAGRGGNPVGGGGAALGGAIFSHNGNVTIQNSTFTNNSVIRGNAGILPNFCSQDPSECIAADNGQDEGGAIFAVDGNLTVQNATISGNTSTGEGAGIVVDVEDIVQHTPQGDIVFHPPTSFTLENTIISNPSARECFYRGGAGVAANGDGNLIVNNFGCPGMVVSTPPLLGPLALNPPGLVPTLELIRSSSDPALNAAAGGLPTDERGFPRPQGTGFDIGAYELCAPKDMFDLSCLRIDRPLPPQTETLIIQISPPGAGVTSPIAGSYTEALNSVIPLSVTHNPGYSFVNWTGGVADPANPVTMVTMDQDRTITANFRKLNATLFGNITTKTGPTNARLWTLSLLNNGPDDAQVAVIDGFTLTQTFGPACTPVIQSTFLLVGNLAPSQTGTATASINFTGCAASARFTAKFTYSANGGNVSGYVTRTNQYQ